MILNLSKALVYTAVISLLLTPIDFKLAKKIGAIDTPNDNRRMHTKPIPRIGGISIFAAFLIACLWFSKEITPDIIAFLSGASIIISLGIIDDSLSLSAKSKLLFQLAAASASVFTAYDGGVFSKILSVLWLVALTNAHNFIDGLNGLCAGISINEAAAIGVVLLLSGRVTPAITAFALCGACIGFLPYNAGKAKIFMGDTGSNFLGFTLGFLSLYIEKDLSVIALIFVILLIFSVPLTDMFFAITRRLIHGKSPFAPDRSHIHHILADSPLGHLRASLVLRIISFLCALMGITAFAIFT
ncbi:MAG: undecaprenyl/decaprenyl-phosphate alpha-N-acetylglucosaminyl 1-phosphate transferase [Clostridia bacterium]|nr:undecaprenyl/decaprenyl-phosphate alpha-N-acetylglucosaminyl 1-phosphate transferase [Clostridia bacterium]